MNWLLASIGISITLFGFCIWRFRLVHWLNNVPAGVHLNKDKTARLAGGYLILIGICFLLFAYLVEKLSDQAIMVIVACFIPVNMVVLISYLVAQSKNMH
ncbi:hypothetical protein FEM33_15375 [Dyadobacter flavalbus]|uniref:DUF3784 domain-containing protein n=1 Tax=Dyadobacter flavalbus TaxID=2579942 RepID=A0A5M8QU84_9BACT|nr:hypothetical protein [Dyadobacter flavalbus]KAA6438851.1 hypothetical protein FEM33_15375 [Dyadobacter flavalbus]